MVADNLGQGMSVTGSNNLELNRFNVFFFKYNAEQIIGLTFCWNSVPAANGTLSLSARPCEVRLHTCI